MVESKLAGTRPAQDVGQREGHGRSGSDGPRATGRNDEVGCGPVRPLGCPFGQPAERRVLLKHPHRPNEPGKWFDVPYSAVIDQPNMSGIAMVWWWPFYDIDGSMTPMWRCFIAGTGG